MKLKTLFQLLFVSFIFVSCKINGNFKGLYGYYSKTYKEKPELFLKTSNIDTICNKKNNINEKIIITNGVCLKECLKNYEKTIIYIWSPNCHSDFCVPLQIIQKKCNEYGYNLFVVAEYYDSEKMDYHYNIENNIYGIDVLFYKTNFTKKYLDFFLKDIDKKLIYSKIQNRFIEFHNNKYINSYRSINHIPNEN